MTITTKTTRATYGTPMHHVLVDGTPVGYVMKRGMGRGAMFHKFTPDGVAFGGAHFTLRDALRSFPLAR